MSINLKQDIKPISYIRENAADMMKYINEVRNPVIITQNGEARAVLLDIASYQEMQDAFSLLKIARLAEKQIKNGKFKTTDQLFSEMEEKLDQKL